jgi:alkylated DNA repair dioxygenase AlkB
MKQLSFFNNTVAIPGLEYIPEYISPEYEQELINLVDSQPWNLELKRRTQHYGYKYDYKARSIDQSYYLGALPYWLDELCNKLYSNAIFNTKPDQVIANEYMPGRGIAPHIDCTTCFSETICSLSLISGCMMDFSNQEKQHLYLEPRSLLIMKDEARYKWKHGISPRKKDYNIKRERRISLTFRKVLIKIGK